MTETHHLVLAALEDAGIRIAVLHDESTIAAGPPTTDIDIALSVSGYEALWAIADRLANQGIFFVGLWPSDVDTVNVFLFRPMAGDGFQLDMVHSPHGDVGYGFNTGLLLRDAVRGTKYPVPSLLDQALYSMRKDYVKGRQEGAVRAELLHGLAVEFDNGPVRFSDDRAPSAARPERRLRTAHICERAGHVLSPRILGTPINRSIWSGLLRAAMRRLLRIPNPRCDLTYVFRTLYRLLWRSLIGARIFVLVRSGRIAKNAATDLSRALPQLDVVVVSRTMYRCSLGHRLRPSVVLAVKDTRVTPRCAESPIELWQTIHEGVLTLARYYSKAKL